MITPPRRPQFALAVVLLAAAGCGSGEKRLPTFPAGGKVLVSGKPAAGAQVVFHPLNPTPADAPKPTATVKPDGSFALSTYTSGDGAPAGEYAVGVSWPSGGAPIGGDAESGPDRFGSRYADPQKSGLRARVNEAPTEIPPFDLKTR